jgi:hypothetical protein
MHIQAWNKFYMDLLREYLRKNASKYSNVSKRKISSYRSIPISIDVVVNVVIAVFVMRVGAVV